MMPPLQLQAKDFASYLGKELGVSPWLLIDQQRVDQFAAVGGDQQWIHTDPERAAAQTNFGGSIAHGYLILALAPLLMSQVFTVTNGRMGVNRGFDKLRFINPLKVGDKLRLRLAVMAVAASVESEPAYIDVKYKLQFEGENYPKPVCVAELLKRWY
ncbi:MaoC family dehydratase [Dasania sp. GY-MA-18]|uniref:MaoC family dehydratase n=1 Tax=Dasania phycosphaerae TaxID=2950436 RepID=A0A9J6RLE9_9GAMM|nr:MULTISPECIES: MaoC family dehydratase [Dasania]MCR8922723.1 MaoC family dehydratase [Dasania sp. GY-MA-18]MCZ0865153.1 MaoC family dehydratase [Dasania phycosphaerae]MCZ0868879.1 MaoC family dehydratase [Dasania phycosphaerae]